MATTNRDVRNHYLFEIATEVANRGTRGHSEENSGQLQLLTGTTVGGIYSVLKSKAPVTTAEYGDRYTMIGPLNRQSVSLGLKISR